MPQDTLFVDHLVDRVESGDCRDWLPKFPDMSVDAVITDPPWPDTKVCFRLSPGEIVSLWLTVVNELVRIAPRVAVILGCDTDPCFLAPLARQLPFFRVIWLRRIPPQYRGPLLIGADVCYVYGHTKLGEGIRVVGGEVNGPLKKDPDNPHPARRNERHLDWLVKNLTKPGDLVVDPFCGSGTTLVAAARQNRRYFGCDIEPVYVKYAKEWIARASVSAGPG